MDIYKKSCSDIQNLIDGYIFGDDYSKTSKKRPQTSIEYFNKVNDYAKRHGFDTGCSRTNNVIYRLLIPQKNELLIYARYIIGAWYYCYDDYFHICLRTKNIEMDRKIEIFGIYIREHLPKLCDVINMFYKNEKCFNFLFGIPNNSKDLYSYLHELIYNKQIIKFKTYFNHPGKPFDHDEFIYICDLCNPHSGLIHNYLIDSQNEVKISLKRRKKYNFNISNKENVYNFLKGMRDTINNFSDAHL